MRLFFLLFLLVFPVSCGKVTQVVPSHSEARTVDFGYSIPLIPTQGITTAVALTGKPSTANQFSLYDLPIYTAVQGISTSGELTELSWGRATASPSQTSSSNTSATYRVTNFRKDGVEITRSDYQWATFQLSNRQDSWRVQAAKVKVGFPMYLISIYSTRGIVALRAVPHATVSGNTQITLPPVSLYDTFLAIMYLTALAENPQTPDRVSLSALQAVFGPDFFATLRYTPPTPSTALTPESPQWLFDSAFEKRLLTFFYLIQNKEKDAAAKLLHTLPKAFPNTITPESIPLLSAMTTSQNHGL